MQFAPGAGRAAGVLQSQKFFVETSVQDLTTLIPPLLSLCREVGLRICGNYNAPGAEEYDAKDDNSPLTQADIDAHEGIVSGLAQLTPEIPVLSEESSEEDLAGRRDWQTFWMVDPLDGTKEFLGRTGEFTVNIALIRGHVPVLGVLYVPLAETAYVGIPGQLARRYQGPSRRESTLAVRRMDEGRALTVLASRRHQGPRISGCIAWLEERRGPVERLDSGSALKFCQLAEGTGDIYPRFSPCCEWDTAAGQAVLEAAGGALLGLDGQPLRYNTRESLLSPNFIAVADPDYPLWVEMLRQDF